MFLRDVPRDLLLGHHFTLISDSISLKEFEAKDWKYSGIQLSSDSDVNFKRIIIKKTTYD